MLQTSALPANHADLITDVAYDFYGERLATASADQRVKVFSKSSSPTASWTLQDEWKAHQAPITKVHWSHPEHGNLIATASFDRTVRIWEEVRITAGAAGTSGVQRSRDIETGAASASTGPTTRWIERAVMNDAKGSVRSVEFANAAFGLKIATIATDGFLRVYTSLQPVPTDWSLSASVSLPSINPSTSPSTSNGNAAQATDGHPGLLTSSAGQSGTAGATNSTGPGKGNEAFGGWALSWCKEKYWGQVLAVTSGHTGIVKIVSVSGTRPVALALLSPPPGNAPPNGSSGSATETLGAQAVLSLSWAPSCGRSYHLVATGARDGTVRIWKLRAPENAQSGSASKNWTTEIAAEWGKGEATVGKVEWNLTGTVLSIAREDGMVGLWKSTYAGEWQCIGSFSAEAPPQEDTDMVHE